jgi:deoxycytidine triphosphate deaminase
MMREYLSNVALAFAKRLNPRAILEESRPEPWRRVPGDSPSIGVADSAEELKSRNETESLRKRAAGSLARLREQVTEDLQEARDRFLKYRRVDPFPRIPPALLNSGQFFAYVAKTGMIVPFDLNPDLFKLASYDIKLLGEAVYWDKEGTQHRVEITDGERFVLPANSIAFVTLRPFLQIPDYIALRFNLRITNVYRGLLLGTGPLVDPGFQGRLSIPLHNLTTNDYTFTGGEALITVEFTKLAGNWVGQLDHSDGSSRLDFTFRESSDYMFSDRNVYAFLNKIGPYPEVRSSIPRVTAEAEKAARDATRRSELTVLFSAVTTVLAVAGIVSAVWDSTLFTAEISDDLRTQAVEQKAEITSMRNELRLLQELVRDSTVRPAPGDTTDAAN